MSGIIVPSQRDFYRQPYHRRVTIQYPPDVPDKDVLIRLEVVWDARDAKASALAHDAAGSLERLALQRILNEAPK